jgi:hypothetical protein
LFDVTRLVRLGSAAAAAAVLALSVGGSIPASANTGEGAVVVAGTANLPTFPCSANPCATSGHFGSLAAAGATTSPLGAVTSVNAGFQYTELCLPPPSPTAVGPTGTAAGQINASGTGGTGSEFFWWQRVGLTAILLLDNSPYNTGAVTGNAHANGIAAAVFAPEGVPGGCNASGINALVAGAGVWAGAA